MDVVLLAGGYGTRLRPLTYTRPKPLLPVAGRPMVDWVLDRLPPEAKRVIVAVNWKAQALGTHFAGADKKRKVDFVVVKEDEPLGTAGAIKNCEKHMVSDRFMVLNADIVSGMDLGALARAHRESKGVGTISLKEVAPADVVNFGVIRPDGDGPAGTIKIAEFVEKPKDPAKAPSRLINAGAYVLDRSVLDLVPTGKLVSLEKEIFPDLIPKGFYGLPFEGHWIDVGDPTRLRQAAKTLAPDYKVGPNSRIAPDARFIDSVAGKDVTIATGAHVERCVLGDGVTIAAGVKVVDCIIGDGEAVRSDATSQRIWTKPIPSGYPAQQVGNAL